MFRQSLWINRVSLIEETAVLPHHVPCGGERSNAAMSARCANAILVFRMRAVRPPMRQANHRA
jgi:hypothetical protein